MDILVLLFQLFTISALSFEKASAYTLRCYSCDGIQECIRPRVKECEKNEECFVIAESYDATKTALRKGCTQTCDTTNIVGKLCRTCRSNLCNGLTGLGQAFAKPSPLPPRGPYGPIHGSAPNRSENYYQMIKIAFSFILINLIRNYINKSK